MNKKRQKTQRHKCHICGAVRYEKRMERMNVSRGEVGTQYGNDQKLWKCKERCWRNNDGHAEKYRG
jgi:hypothetical protein